jgi:hypothetical protein
MALFFAISFTLSLVVVVGFVLISAILIYAISDPAKTAERRDHARRPAGESPPTY